MIGLGGQLGIIPLRGVVSDNQQLVSGPETESRQAKCQMFDIEIVVLPCVRLPDTVVFVTHGPVPFAVFLVVVLEYLGPGIALFAVGLLHPDRHFPLCLTQPPFFTPVVFDFTITLLGAGL